MLIQESQQPNGSGPTAGQPADRCQYGQRLPRVAATTRVDCNYYYNTSFQTNCMSSFFCRGVTLLCSSQAISTRRFSVGLKHEGADSPSSSGAPHLRAAFMQMLTRHDRVLARTKEGESATELTTSGWLSRYCSRWLYSSTVLLVDSDLKYSST